MTELTFQKCDIWPLRWWFHQMELNRIFSPCWGQVKHYSHHSSLHKNISPSLAAVTSLVNLAITRQAASCWYRAWDNSEKGGWREGKGRESEGGGGGTEGWEEDGHEYKSFLVRQEWKNGVTLSGCLQLLTESKAMQHAGILQQETHTPNKNIKRRPYLLSTENSAPWAM